MESGGRSSDLGPMWIGATVTTISVGLFPRLNAVKEGGVPIWELDPEARVLLPVVLILSLLLFVFVGRWAWHGDQDRPTKVGFVCGILSLVGVVVFFLSGPIMLGGLAATLGLEGRRRAEPQGQGKAKAAIALGSLGF